MSTAKRLTYQRTQTGADFSRYAKAVGFPAGIFLLSIFTVHRFNLFGLNIIAPICPGSPKAACSWK